MAEHTATFVPDDAGDSIDFKPLSLLAVGGLGLAALYATLVVIGAVAAYFDSEAYFEPFFFGSWAVALPLAGAVLSGLGLWQIHSSEGTRAGQSLAKWGLVISVVAGVGFFTYQTFTELAILKQAHQFLLEKGDNPGFFVRLQGSEADVRTAFLSTFGDYSERGIRLESDKDTEPFDQPTQNNPKGFLTQFLETPLVRAFRVAAPGSIQITPLAVPSWSYENRAFHLTLLYRISTDEAVYEVPLKVSSIEPIGAGEKRKWRLEWPPPPLQPLSRTELGTKRQGVRQRAREFLNDSKTGWFTYLKDRRGVEVYLDTQLPAERKELRARAEALPNEAKRSKELPGYHPLTKAFDYFKMDKLRVWDTGQTARVQAAAKQALSLERLPLLVLRVVQDDLAPCTVNLGEVLVTYQVELVPSMAGLKSGPDVLLLLKVIVAAPQNLDPVSPAADQQWQLKSAEFVRALEIPRQKL